MERNMDKQLTLPKNIRQIGTFGETYKIYVEDFVYTYVHQMLHEKKEENTVLAAVLLGKTIREEEKEYIFISGAQKCNFHLGQDNGEDVISRQQEFWGSVYQQMKEFFSDQDILGWYINLDGSNLELNTKLQQFFEATYNRGSRFLYYEDSLEHIDAFFVQEQHSLQRISGYAVYYEKNPQMQEFMVSEKERIRPEANKGVIAFDRQEDDVAQNYRAIMSKLSEKPQKKKAQPLVYAAGVAVLAVVSATGITQIGNYQNLKTLETTLQTLSGAADAADTAGTTDTTNTAGTEDTTDAADTTDTAAAADTAAVGQTETVSEPQPEENTDAEENSAENAADAEQTNSEAVQKAKEEQTYYTVKKGDSLVSISKSFYQTTSKIEEICSLNQIEDMDMIYEGQKLKMP